MDNGLIPCNERLAREIVAGLQGTVFSKGFDAEKGPLEKVLAPMNSRRGTRMIAATNGPGKHDSSWPCAQYDVPDGEVYATIDTSVMLAGSLTTHVFKRQEDTLVLVKEIVHKKY